MRTHAHAHTRTHTHTGHIQNNGAVSEVVKTLVSHPT
jgi:hypothetical protein